MMSKMRPLIINEEAKAQIKQVVDYAENHPLTGTYQMGIAEGKNPPPGDNPNHCCLLSYLGKPGTGYSCVYSMDLTKSGRWARHISIGVDGDGAPQPVAIDMIIKEFGFKERLCDDNGQVKKPDESQRNKFTAWIEQDSPLKAVNIVEIMGE